MSPQGLPAWQIALYQQLGLLPTPRPLWKPVYQPPQNTVTADGTITTPINPQYLLTEASAEFLAQKFGATVTPEPFPSSSAVQFMLNFVITDANGNPVPYSINSGLLARYYCPTGGQPAQAVLDNPDIADNEAKLTIAAAGLDALHQVR